MPARADTVRRDGQRPKSGRPAAPNQPVRSGRWCTSRETVRANRGGELARRSTWERSRRRGLDGGELRRRWLEFRIWLRLPRLTSLGEVELEPASIARQSGAQAAATANEGQVIHLVR